MTRRENHLHHMENYTHIPQKPNHAQGWWSVHLSPQIYKDEVRNYFSNDMIKNLWTTYGKIDMNDLTANETKIKQQWDPPTPIETLFKQLKDGREFAASGIEIISDSQLVRFGYDIMTNTGVLSILCTKRRNKKTGDQNWTKFITHFTAAVKDYNKNITSSDMKYSAA